MGEPLNAAASAANEPKPKQTALRTDETVEEFMMSALFGMEVTQQQIGAAKRRKPLTENERLVGPIGKKWHKKHEKDAGTVSVPLLGS